MHIEYKKSSIFYLLSLIFYLETCFLLSVN